MGNNKTKNIILAVLVVGIVSMTIAFAALTQQLNITDNVATVSSNWRVRFAPTVTTSVGTTIAGTTTGATYTSNTPIVTNDQQTITGLQATFTKPGDYVEVAFTVRNEGNIAAKGQGVTLSLGNLTCAPGSGSSVSQEAANTFCTKLVKWVKHSDRVTDWTSADTLAAYTGSGAYPSIDGILRIEYPSALTNSDINAINGGSIVVTLGDTTLHFEQDDNVTASNNSGSGSGSQEPVTPSNPYLTTFDGNYTYRWSDVTTEGYTEIYDEEYGEGTGWYTSLNPNSEAYLRTDGTTPETCGVLSGGTVCMTSPYYLSDYSSANSFNVDMEDCPDSEEYDGTGTTCLKGYVKAKVDELLSNGVSYCNIFNYDSGSGEIYCYDNNDSSVATIDNYQGGYVSFNYANSPSVGWDGSYWCN